MHIMKCPKCSFESGIQTKECPRCGIIFDKYINFIKNGPADVLFKSQSETNKIDKSLIFKHLFFYVKQ